MTSPTPSLLRPIRATFLTFLGLSGFTAICLPFQNDFDPAKWPLAFGYCAILAVSSIGLARHGSQGLLLFGLPAIVALLPAIIGIALMILPDAPLGAGAKWLTASQYLLYTEAMWCAFLTVVGWMMLYKDLEGWD